MDKILTIVIPSYNAEKCLAKCLDSLIDERVIGFLDVIVVNDGSQDKTSEIAHNYKERFPNSIRVFDKENGGHGSGVNAGIKNAKGKYFKVLDSDDWFDTNNLALFVEKLKIMEIDLVITNFTEIDALTNQQHLRTFNNPKNDLEVSIDDCIKQIPYFYMTRLCVKTALLQKNKVQLQEKTFYVDNEFCVFSVAFASTVTFFDINLYQYLVGQATQSISRENMVHHIPDTMRVAYRLVEFYSKQNEARKQRIKGLVCAFVLSFYHIALIFNRNKKVGKGLYNGYNTGLKLRSKEIYFTIHFKSRIYYLMSLFRVSPAIYDKIQKLRRGANK
ncbi:MAG: glycosyltransferase family 2 protein [Clostridiales bacterium]|nr:glycosyltransferase family 2 protein [Clostridiales bacterium]